MKKFKNSSKPTILVVEDDLSAIEMIRPALINFKVDIISSPKEAISKIKQNTYQLLLIDLHFTPDPRNIFAGVKLIRECRRKGINIPIIAMTNYEHLNDVAIAAGATEFLSKKTYHPKKWKQLLENKLKVEQNE